MRTRSQTPTQADFFTFREPGDPRELEDLLRLRYRIFRGCNLRKFVRENRHEIDVDAYDLRARHFGLFAVSNSGEEAVGYLRVVEDRTTPHATLVRELLDDRPDLAHRIADPPTVPFPLLSYFPDAAAVVKLYWRIREQGSSLVEASRLVLAPEYQTLRLSRHVIESAVATYFFHFRCGYAAWCCDSSKTSFYRLFGFRHLHGTVMGDFLGIDEPSCCVVGSRDYVPVQAAEKFEGMARAFADSGEICYLPHDRKRFKRNESIPAVKSREPDMAVA